VAFRRLGQILVDLKMLTLEQVQDLLDEQQENPGILLGKLAIQKGLIREEQLIKALGQQFGMPTLELAELVIPGDVLGEITETMAQMYRIIPVRLHQGTLTVAMCDPQNLTTLDELRTLLGKDVRGVVSTETDVQKALERYYSGGDDINSIIDELNADAELKRKAEELAKGKYDLTGEASLAESAPVRKLLNMILLLAIKDRASDIHFEPFEQEFKVRIKADGVLYEMVPPPRHLAMAVITRVKVMANLDIAERRLPQDGRIELLVGGHAIDLRVSVLPTLFGESVVMRVLDRSVVNLDLNAVGLDAALLEKFRQVIERPHGVVLVTGPTGSGKTTTLYSVLSELNDIRDKLITTEDPVEYQIEGIVQIPVDSSIGVTFASCLRAILRQDPDIILVGEIRDYETAEIAIQASLTGHLVFSTLHTNDAPSTITRLRDMGVPPFMVTATVEAVLAQRLVRRICAHCRTEISPTQEMLAELNLQPDQVVGRRFFKGMGCENCNNSGFKGRIGIFELMILNEELKDMVMRNCSDDDLRQAARGFGMIPLRDGGMNLIYDGVTTVEEIIRETVFD